MSALSLGAVPQSRRHIRVLLILLQGSMDEGRELHSDTALLGIQMSD